MITVRNENQKKIVVGKNGATLKHIGMGAQRELEELFDQRVHLIMRVKVRGARQHFAHHPDADYDL